MFENIIGQAAVHQLGDDIVSGRAAPSMLFYGPCESGKGSAALELSRVLSCEADPAPVYAPWKCECSSCERHRYLLHDDLLVLGNRSFLSEIAACGSVFLRNHTVSSCKKLFYRSLRKLQLRFSPVLAEDNDKMRKSASVLLSFDEKLNELWTINAQTCDKAALEKLCKALTEDAVVLEKDGLSALIPINHIRNASWWCRLAPNGKRKTLIIENAENMREEARNSLLKLLEEPPPNVSIVMTAQRREAIMPTILSRLRPYRFLKRDSASEKEVIRLVFKDTLNEITGKNQGSLISAYLESFAPQSTEKMYPLAAWFIVSLARITAISVKKSEGKQIPSVVSALGERYAQIAETLKLERTLTSAGVIKIVIAQSNNFEDDSFPSFMKICLELICDVTRTSEDPRFIVYNDAFKKYTGEAVNSVEILNISKTTALEGLLYNLKKALKEGKNG